MRPRLVSKSRKSCRYNTLDNRIPQYNKEYPVVIFEKTTAESPKQSAILFPVDGPRSSVQNNNLEQMVLVVFGSVAMQGESASVRILYAVHDNLHYHGSGPSD